MWHLLSLQNSVVWSWAKACTGARDRHLDEAKGQTAPAATNGHFENVCKTTSCSRLAYVLPQLRFRLETSLNFARKTVLDLPTDWTHIVELGIVVDTARLQVSWHLLILHHAIEFLNVMSLKATAYFSVLLEFNVGQPVVPHRKIYPGTIAIMKGPASVAFRKEKML